MEKAGENETFWKSICIPIDEIRDRFPKLKAQFKKKLSNDKNYFDFISEFCEADSSKLKIGDNKVDYLLSSPKFLEYCFLDEFIKGRKELLELFIKKPNFNGLFLPTDDLLIKIIKLYRNNRDYIIHALLFCEFSKKQGVEKFLCSPIWEDKYSTAFKDAFQELSKLVKKRYKRKFVHIKSFSDGSSEYHVFHRAKRTAIQESFELKNVSYIKKSDLFVFINKDKNTFEIRCGDSRLRGLIIDFIKEKIKVNLLYTNNTQVAKDLSNTIKTLLISIPESLSEGEIFIDQAKLKKTEISPNVPLTIGHRNMGDIRNTLHSLNENGVIDIENIDNISSFNVNIDGKSYNIRIKREEDGSIVLKYDGDSDGFVQNKIQEKWSLSINTPIQIEWGEINYPTLFNNLLDYDGRSRLNDTEKDFLNKMFKDSLIIPEEHSTWTCEKPTHIFVTAHKKCPDCGGELKVVKNYTGSKANIEGIALFIENRLKKIYGLNSVRKSKRKYRNKDFNLLFIENSGNPFHIYIDYNERNIKQLLLHFQRSLLPVIIINIKNKPKGLIDEELFPVISLSDFYLKEDLFFKKVVEKLNKNYFSRLESAAKSASDNLLKLINKKHKDYDETDLEDDTFSLMKYIFQVGEKWGKESNRKTVPEATLGYICHIMNETGNFKNKAISLIWDSKFHNIDGGTYNFNTSERDKARRYIIVANQSEAIIDFSENLTAYINFCNSVNIKQYENFSKYLYKYKTWKGTVVLFDLDALLKLYDFVVAERELFNNKREFFLSEFFKLLARKEDNFNHIEKEKIDSLISNLKNKDENKILNTLELKQHLELNEIR